MSPERKPRESKATRLAREGLEGIEERARSRSNADIIESVVNSLLDGSHSEIAPPAVPSEGIPHGGTVLPEYPVPYPEGTVPRQGIPLQGTVRGYTQIANAVLDELLKTMPAYDQLVYLRLYRLTRGFQRETCTVGYVALARATNLSKNTIIRSIERLVARGLVVRSAAGSGAAAGVYGVVEPAVPSQGIPRRGIPREGTVPREGSMKVSETKKEKAPVSVEEKIRTKALILRALHDGDDEYNADRFRRDLALMLRADGLEIDEATITRALAS